MNVRLLFIAISFSFAACNSNTKNTEQAETTVDLEHSSESIIDSVSYTEQVDTTSTEIKTQPEQFVKKHILTSADLYRDIDGGSDLAIFFKIEVISKDTFLTNLSTAADYMIYDSATIIKDKGTLTLPTEKGRLKLQDVHADNDSHIEYKYVGQFKGIDMYLVLALFWEDWNYMLFDKKQGHKVQSFISQPYLSTDLQYIICLDVDSFEGSTSLNLYGISTNEITRKKYIDPIVEIYVKSWIPYTEKYPMFWGKDGYFYVPVIYSNNFVDAQNNFYNLDQYIRILPIAS